MTTTRPLSLTAAALAACLATLLPGCAADPHAAAPDAAAQAPAAPDDRPTATGVVFHDRDADRKYDPGEPTLQGVRVSNGREITRTDADGRWRLPYDPDDTTFFVLKPRGWRVPLDGHHLPQFYYTHRPAGSPDLRFPGVEPTGPLPDSIDFPLYPSDEPDRFRAIFFADPQPRDQAEIDYITHDVVAELIGTDAAFGVTLGDILFDDLSLFHSLNRSIALIGIPWYNVVGNHDINFDAPDDYHSNETFRSVYGPPYYSFDHGPVHFIVLDNVNWMPADADRPGRYNARIDDDQMAFVRADLADVPDDRLVVLMMHIPLTQIENRQELYRLIEHRPFTFSISGHTHWMEHRFVDHEDGWRGPEPHHHVINVTVSGSWWSGEPDERGIPHTLMRDGAPNGYSILTFDGHQYDIAFKPASEPEAYQIHLMAPEAAAPGRAVDLWANVFAGSERSEVAYRLNGRGGWTAMDRRVTPDPRFVGLHRQQEGRELLGRPLPRPVDATHLWHARLTAPADPGTHLIEVRTTDMFGQTHHAYRALRVEAPAASAAADPPDAQQ